VDRRRVIPIFLIVFVNFLGATIVLPTLPLYARREFDAAPEVVTLLNASFFAAQFLALPFIGRLSDRYGRLPVLIISQIGTVISFLIMPLAQSLIVLFAARILDGITGGNIIVAQAYVTDITPREKRTQALGIIFMAFGLGLIFGPALGGIVALWGDQIPFYVGGAISLAMVILTWLTLDESLTPEKRREQRERQIRLRPADVLHNPALLLIMLIGFGAQMSFALFNSTLPLFGESVLFRPALSLNVFDQTHNLNALMSLFNNHNEQVTNLGVGLLFTAIGVGQFFTQVVLIRRLVERFGENRLVIFGALLRGIGLLSLLFFVSPWLVGGFSMIAFAIGSGTMMPSLQSLATTTAPEEIRGGILGVYQSSVSLGIITGSALGGLLFTISPTTPFLVGGLTFIVVAFPALLLMRRMHSPTPLREASAVA
jgi:MFS transporter, DHA1 family, tetracycline resistance protein